MWVSVAHFNRFEGDFQREKQRNTVYKLQLGSHYGQSFLIKIKSINKGNKTFLIFGHQPKTRSKVFNLNFECVDVHDA